MNKSKLKVLIITLACILVLALTAGLIVHFTVGKNRNADDKPKVAISGKVYDENGDVMDTGKVYSLPRIMTISELQENTVSQVTLTASVIPENATDGTVTWSIKFDDGSDTDYYLTLEPTYLGATTAVLTCREPFDDTAIITVTSNYDETKKAECTVDYLYNFNPIDLSMTYSDVVFKQDNRMDISYTFLGNGSIEGDFEYGDLYIELNHMVISEINSRLGSEFTPTYKILSTGYDSDGITFHCGSPFECFAANSGLDEQTFNEAFARAIYFGCGPDCDYHSIIHFTAKYSYKGSVVSVEEIWHEGVERLTADFSLENIVIPVDDVIIEGDDITFNTGTSSSLVCGFDGGSAISTDARIKVTGKQSTCESVTVNALEKAFSKYLKMESSTEITFTTTATMKLTLYVDTADKKIKVDGASYVSALSEAGDNIVTITLDAGEHTITKGDVLGLFALQLEAA